LKVSIGQRLFFAVLLSLLQMAEVGVELVRCRLSESASSHAGDEQGLSGLIGMLSAGYQQHHDWSFLPARIDERKSGLRDRLMDAEAGQTPNSGARIPSPSLGYRIDLLDSLRRHRAGMVASPAMIAIASIDTVQRPINVNGATVGYLVDARSQNPDDGLAVALLLAQ
jgi:two-component system sensor histidine kinase BaeS